MAFIYKLQDLTLDKIIRQVRKGPIINLKIETGLPLPNPHMIMYKIYENIP